MQGGVDLEVQPEVAGQPREATQVLRQLRRFASPLAQQDLVIDQVEQPAGVVPQVGQLLEVGLDEDSLALLPALSLVDEQTGEIQGGRFGTNRVTQSLFHNGGKAAQNPSKTLGKVLSAPCQTGIQEQTLSPDGKRLASASHDQTIKLWDTVTFQETLTLRGHTDLVTGLAFSPDSNKLATCSPDGTARVWDATPLAGAVPR